MAQQECNIDKIISDLSKLETQLKDIPRSQKATANKNEQEPSEEKRPSLWGLVRERVKKICKGKKEVSNSGGSQGGSTRSKGNQEDADDLEIQRLQSDIRQMIAAFKNLKEFQTKMSMSLKRDLPKVGSILTKTATTGSRSNDLKDIRGKILALKCEIPSLLYKQSSGGLSTTDSQTARENDEINENGSDIFLPGLHVSKDFRETPAFEEVVEKFQGLGITEKLCLLSFAVFPENLKVKKTMLMYWWIGEEFITCDEDPETSATEILREFSRKGLLEPAEEERKQEPSSYKMEPHVHSAVIYLAEDMGIFELYSKGKLTMKKSSMQKVCLVKESSLSKDVKASAMEPKTLQTVFNSSERYPDFTFKWLPSMVELRVLYLGRWERTATRHIEVESTKFPKKMKALKNLRLASFQGISRIEKLENSFCELPELVILDLKACYNLEVIPEDIALLRNLVYLDVSECYMLGRMPEGIADLGNLQVLKGFVISESEDESDRAVKNLEKLRKLRKLSITVNKYLFDVKSLMESLKDLKHLESLKIAWGARFKREKTEESDENNEYRETTNEEKENQKGPATEDLKEEKTGDVEERGKREDGRNETANLEEGKKQDEAKAESLKSDEVVEGEKKTSSSQEATETIQNKPDEQKVEKERDGDNGEADLDEGKKRDEEVAEISKAENVVKGDEKTSPPQESKDINQNKAGDRTKVEKEGDGDKEKANPEEGKKDDEVEAESTKSDNGVEGVKKASPSQESTESMPEDHQRGDKQEEKGDGENEKVNLEGGKKIDEVKADSSKPDKVIEGDEKKNPPPIQSKPDDHREISEVQEKGDKGKNGDDLKNLDGGEAKTQKPRKTIKFGKKVSFSENSKRDNAMAQEIHETPSPSRSPKESRSNQENWFTAIGNKTKKFLQYNPAKAASNTKLPSSLKKLELECFPDENPPSWLNPKDLNNLEKLSIKGGKLSRISDENKWHVRTLRLKYLHGFKVEWKDLCALFPDMTLLEKYECPKISFCPTDGNGVWRKP